MKQFSASTMIHSSLIMSAVLVSAAFLSSCASHSASERAAARQRNGASEEVQTMAQLPRESGRGSGSIVLAAGPAPAPAAAQAAASGDAAKGKEVFEQCAICHNVDNDEAKMGPSLKGLFKKEKLKSGKPATEENVRAIINAGGNGMPGYEEMLEKDQMTDLMAYLKTL